jgi:hypothetical protein
MAARQILFEWTDGDNPEQIVLPASDFSEDTDSADSLPLSRCASSSAPGQTVPEVAPLLACSSGLKGFDVSEAGVSVSNSIEMEDLRADGHGETPKPDPTIQSKRIAPYKIPIWRFPDDTIVPTQLFMTSRPQVAEKSSISTDNHPEDERFPRYIMVFRRQVHTRDVEPDELLGEIKIERRTSLAELRRIITEDFWQRLVFRSLTVRHSHFTGHALTSFAFVFFVLAFTSIELQDGTPLDGSAQSESAVCAGRLLASASAVYIRPGALPPGVPSNGKRRRDTPVRRKAALAVAAAAGRVVRGLGTLSTPKLRRLI